jgi:FkbH-like protein
MMPLEKLQGHATATVGHPARPVKCVVWDLDNTLWDGVLLEDRHIALKGCVRQIIETLDQRGILQSIASKNEHEHAVAKLQEFGIEQYFLYPQIHWNTKVDSIRVIASTLNIGMDSILLIDDQEYERDVVLNSLPMVRCMDPATCLDTLLNLPEMNPRFITEDSRMRRQMYVDDMERKGAEEKFDGPKEEFLSQLRMKLTLSSARTEDLQRLEELTIRAHQLNTTGYVYSYEQLQEFAASRGHKLLVAGLVDKYGPYGKAGLALVECGPDMWTIKLLLVSCRVVSRGIGTMMLHHIVRLAHENHVRLRAEFIPNGRNRMMLVTYKFADFQEIERHSNMVLLERHSNQTPEWPSYLEIEILP